MLMNDRSLIEDYILVYDRKMERIQQFSKTAGSSGYAVFFVLSAYNLIPF